MSYIHKSVGFRLQAKWIKRHVSWSKVCKIIHLWRNAPIYHPDIYRIKSKYILSTSESLKTMESPLTHYLYRKWMKTDISGRHMMFLFCCCSFTKWMLISFSPIFKRKWSTICNWYTKWLKTIKGIETNDSLHIIPVILEVKNAPASVTWLGLSCRCLF